MTPNLIAILILLIPLGVCLAALFAGILAHRGQTSSGTWTLLVASASMILLCISFGILQYFITSRAAVFSDKWEFYENCMLIILLLASFSVLAYAAGIFKMSKQWKTHFKETTDLEKRAEELAVDRDKSPIS